MCFCHCLLILAVDDSISVIPIYSKSEMDYLTNRYLSNEKDMIVRDVRIMTMEVNSREATPGLNWKNTAPKQPPQTKPNTTLLAEPSASAHGLVFVTNNRLSSPSASRIFPRFLFNPSCPPLPHPKICCTVPDAELDSWRRHLDICGSWHYRAPVLRA